MSTLWEQLKEIFFSIIPVFILVMILQVTLIRLPLELFLQFLAGTAFVILGLTLFLSGLKIGLLPIGEAIGSELPTLQSLTVILFTIFLLSFSITLAEPDVRILTHQVDTVSGGEINQYLLIFSIALGVGIFAVIAIIRSILGLSIAKVLGIGYTFILLLSFYTPADFFAVAYDAGGVTTGPMAVPVILSLGVGVASVLGRDSTASEEFGLVGIASMGPIIGVMLLGVIFG